MRGRIAGGAKRRHLDRSARRGHLQAMTIHVTIGEAEKRLAELVAAAVRGEEVVLAEAGACGVRLVPLAAVPAMDEAERERIRAKRASAFGMYAHLVGHGGIDVRALRMTDAEWEERDRRKFGPPD